MKVVITGFRKDVIGDPEAYQRLGVEVVHRSCRTEDELIAATVDADVIIKVAQTYSRRVIAGLGRCRLISVVGTGFEAVDVKAATDYGIIVSNVPDYCLDELSDHTMGLILACSRKILPIYAAVRQGLWDTSEKPHIRYEIMPTLRRLRGQTLGLIGFGNVAQRLAPKAQAFGMRIIAYSPHVTESIARSLGVEMTSLDRVIRDSDFVSIHTSVAPEKRHMIGAEEIQKMKRTVFLINTARGELVDEAALIGALREGVIAGAALDVMEHEPPRLDNPLLTMDNVILTAHTAWVSQEASTDMRRRLDENVLAVLRGEWPRGMVNHEVKERYEQRWGKMLPGRSSVGVTGQGLS